MRTPALNKQREAIAPRPVNDVLTEFVDWLTSQEIVLARYGRRWEEKKKCHHCHGRGFEADALTARERQLLHRGLLPDVERAPCPVCRDRSGYVWVERCDEDSLEPIQEPWGRLFARFLDLDEDAMEDERRAILEELRSA